MDPQHQGHQRNEQTADQKQGIILPMNLGNSNPDYFGQFQQPSQLPSNTIVPLDRTLGYPTALGLSQPYDSGAMGLYGEQQENYSSSVAPTTGAAPMLNLQERQEASGSLEDLVAQTAPDASIQALLKQQVELEQKIRLMHNNQPRISGLSPERPTNNTWASSAASRKSGSLMEISISEIIPTIASTSQANIGSFLGNQKIQPSTSQALSEVLRTNPFVLPPASQPPILKNSGAGQEELQENNLKVDSTISGALGNWLDSNYMRNTTPLPSSIPMPLLGVSTHAEVLPNEDDLAALYGTRPAGKIEASDLLMGGIITHPQRGTENSSSDSLALGAWSASSAQILTSLAESTEEKAGKKASKRDSQKPKRPLSAYNIFFKEERQRILDELPTTVPAKVSTRVRKKKPHGKIGFQNLARVIGKRWQDLTEHEMQGYKEKAKVDLERYKREMEEYVCKS